MRSSRGHVVTASGLRWVCLRLLVPLPWAGRPWARPVLTARAPSARDDREQGRRHTSLTDWARQLLLVVRRWWPERAIVAVAQPGGLVRQAAWYRKRHPAFAVALALVRRELWQHQAFSTSPCAEEMVKVPRALVATLTETLCYVA